MKKQDFSKKYKSLSPQFIFDQKGNRSMVLLKFDIFETLLEDLDDLSVLAKRKDEEEIPFDVIEKKLKRDGKI